MAEDSRFVKHGLTSPPKNGNAFDQWQSQVDLIILQKLHEIEVNCPMCQGRWRMAKVMLGICATFSAVAAACAAFLRMGK